MTTAFLSFAHDDRPVAAQVDRVLRQYGVQTFNMAAIKPGANVSQVIDDNIERSDAFVFLISRNFARSEWANIEVAAAMAGASTGSGKLILPVLIGKNTDPASDVPSLLQRYQWLDLRDGVADHALAPLAEALSRGSQASGLDEQLDSEEALLTLRKKALERERWAYAIERPLHEAQVLRRWSIIALVIATLTVTLASLAVLRADSGQSNVVLSLAALAGGAMGSVITLLVERRSRRLGGERLRRGRRD